jgi:hypothetical protein
MTLPKIAFTTLVFIALATACGDDDHSAAVPSCAAIIAACHEVDPGTGRIAECHETAHDVGTAEACDPIEAECVALCEALHDGGAGEMDGGAGAADGGL